MTPNGIDFSFLSSTTESANTYEGEGQHLEHWPGVVSMGGSVPEVIGLQPLVHQVPGLSQQALPLNIHPMLLVPRCARPAEWCLTSDEHLPPRLKHLHIVCIV